MVTKAERAALQRLVEKLALWRAEPWRFPLEAFEQPPTPEEWQNEALIASATHDRLAIRSGHGVGKTAYLSWQIFLYLVTHNPCRIPCTAPSAHQLEVVLWSELAQWHRRMHPWLKSLINVKSGIVEATWAPKEAFAVARTSRREQPEAFAGFHSENMLFICDEASGIPDEVFEVGSGVMSTRGAKNLMTSNPTRRSGYFYDVFHPKSGAKKWWTRRVGCEESTQVDPEYIEDMAARYGIDSNVYRVRVMGEFPRQDDDSIIPIDLIEAAIARDVEPIDGPVVWGLDVAGGGKVKNSLAKRMLNTLLEPVRSWSEADLMVTVDHVVMEYEQTEVFRRPEEILVDAIGLGAGVAHRLREQGLPAKAIQVSERHSANESTLRLRDELWFMTREWFASREVTIPQDDVLVTQLTSVTWKPTSSGKAQVFKVQSKSDMTSSPNEADAFVLTFAASRRFQWATGANVIQSSKSLPIKANSRYSPHKWRAKR